MVLWTFIPRDVKGANILVDTNGKVKLADFGMAKHVRPPFFTQTMRLSLVFSCDAHVACAFGGLGRHPGSFVCLTSGDVGVFQL